MERHSLTSAQAQHAQDDARERGRWLVWFVERRDGGFVAYGVIPDNSGGTRVPGELLSADTLDELRAMLPAGMTRRERSSVMSDAIVETWDAG